MQSSTLIRVELFQDSFLIPRHATDKHPVLNTHYLRGYFPVFSRLSLSLSHVGHLSQQWWPYIQPQGARHVRISRIQHKIRFHFAMFTHTLARLLVILIGSLSASRLFTTSPSPHFPRTSPSHSYTPRKGSLLPTFCTSPNSECRTGSWDHLSKPRPKARGSEDTNRRRRRLLDHPCSQSVVCRTCAW